MTGRLDLRHSETAPTHVWFWRKFRGDRKGDPCRVIVPPATNGNIMVEFTDGERIVAPRYCVRRLPA